jgi:hypothetical protein
VAELPVHSVYFVQLYNCWTAGPSSLSLDFSLDYQLYLVCSLFLLLQG